MKNIIYYLREKRKKIHKRPGVADDRDELMNVDVDRVKEKIINDHSRLKTGVLAMELGST